MIFSFLMFADKTWEIVLDLDDAKKKVANHKWSEYYPVEIRWYKLLSIDYIHNSFYETELN